MAESLKKQTIKGVAWSGVEKVLTYIIAFVVNVIMARLLTPADYGVVGIIAVFVSFSELFIDGGFSRALISKTDRNKDDYKTVFVFNFLMSVFLYVVLFFTAPIIDRFYNISGLASVIRVYCIMLVISSLSSIQFTRFNIAVDFKTISKTSIPSSIIAGIAGITCAYMGCGVWSIVVQHLTNATLRVILVLYYSKWFPKIGFSIISFKRLFKFSSNLIVSSLIDRIYTNIYPLFIGKAFSPQSLGFYTRGDQFGKLPAGIFEGIFDRVSFPIMSKVQDDYFQLQSVYRKFIKYSSFIIFPIMMLVVVLAEPIVKILLTDKWLECVIFMQIISVSCMMNHIGNINRYLLYVKQHSDYALKLEILKKSIALTIFFISTYFGILGVCIGQCIYGLIAPSLNSVYTKRLIGISFFKQLEDYVGLWLLSVISAFLPLWVISLINNPWMDLLVGTVIYITLYLLLNYIFGTDSIKWCLATIKDLLIKK